MPTEPLPVSDTAPAPYYDEAGIVIYHGDCREVLPHLEGVTACVTDPPYGLSFMGKGWDHGVPGVGFWQGIMAAMLPGAPLLAFGGARTFHRMTCAIEDAGFEIRDCLSWLYGVGFPKSLNVQKAIRKHLDPDPKSPAETFIETWEGYGTALKPAWEPVVLAMKPNAGTFAQNAEAHGVAGLNIDAGRIPTDERLQGSTVRDDIRGGEFAGGHRPNPGDIPDYQQNVGGRWPANVCLDPESARLLDEQTGERPTGNTARPGRRREGDGYGMGELASGPAYTDSGGASRFFYCSKASRAERGDGNNHPTVKPLDLMRWLLSLVTYPERNLILDPFAGSGTTLLAARSLGLPCIGIEQSEEYCEIVARRLEEAKPEPLPLFEGGVAA